MKNSILLLFCFTFSLSYLFSQEQEEITTREKKVNILHYGINITPKYAHLIFENSDLGESNNQINFSTGVHLYIDLNENLQITTGLNYSNIKTSTIDFTPQFSCDHTGTDLVDPHGSYFEDIIKAHFVGIEAGTKFILPNSNKHWFAAGGIELLGKISSSFDRAVIECGQETFLVDPVALNSMNNVIFKVNLGFGYQYDYLPTMKWVFSPQLKYTLGGILKGDKLVQNVINNFNVLDIGLKIGLIF